MFHATQVIVFDTQSGEKIGTIPDTPGVHGVAVAHQAGPRFVSAGRANNVVVFDLKTFEVKSKIRYRQRSDWIYYDEAANKVFTCNGGSTTDDNRRRNPESGGHKPAGAASRRPRCGRRQAVHQHRRQELDCGSGHPSR